MNDFASVLRGLDWSVPVQLLLSVLPALICITLHECAHGMTAYMLGDDTAKRAGRLSLNPIKHIDVLGLVMLVVFRFGWAKPVPVNMNNFRNPKQGMALTAAAGPLANLVISIIALFIYGLLFIPLGRYEWGWYLLETVYVTALPEPHARPLQHHPHPAARREQGAVLRRVRAELPEAHVL